MLLYSCMDFMQKSFLQLFNLVILLVVVAFGMAQLMRSAQHRTFTVYSALLQLVSYSCVWSSRE